MSDMSVATGDRAGPKTVTSRPAAVTTYAVFTGRAVRRIFRRADTIVSTVIFPALLLLTLLAAFGSSVEAFEGDDYAQRLVPGMIVSGVMFGSVGAVMGLWGDLRSGFMDRIRSMPLPAVAPLIGTVVAETVRAIAAVVVLVALGYAFGFRFENGPLPTIAFFGVAGIAAMSLSMIGLAAATVAKTQEGLGPPVSALFLLMLFFSKGMIPLDGYPGWARPIVEASPATAYVELLDRLARGGALWRPTLIAAAWSLGLIGVLGSVAANRLRRHAAA